MSAYANLYIIAGQSNAEGTGTNTDLAAHMLRYNTRICYKPSDTYQRNMRVEHLEVGRNQQFNFAILSRFGPEVGLAYVLDYYQPGGSILCKYTLSGSPLLAGDAGGTPGWEKSAGELYPSFLYAWLRPAVELLRESGYQPIIRGFLWMQGEGDSQLETSANNYYTALTQFCNDLKTDLGIVGVSMAQTKIVIGRLHNRFNPGTRPYLDTLRQAQEDFVFGSPARNRTAYPNSYLLDTDRYGLLADNTHYNTWGALQLGHDAGLIFTGNWQGMQASERSHA